MTLSVNPPAGSTFPRGNGAPWPSISPDGRLLAFVAIARGGQQLLWVRRLDSTSVRALDGTDGAARPFWSPDSRSLRYCANGQLARVDVDTGDVRVLTDAAYLGSLAGAWGDGVIVWKGVGGFYSVADGGGQAKLLWPNPAGFNPVVPSSCPMAGASSTRSWRPRRRVGSAWAQSTRRTRGAPRCECAGPLRRAGRSAPAPGQPAGRTAVQSGSPGDLRRTVHNRSRSVQPVRRIRATAVSRVRWRRAGLSVSTGPAVLTWVDQSGTPQGLPFGEGIAAALSPDGRQMVVSRRDAQSDNFNLWLIGVDQKSPRRDSPSGADGREGRPIRQTAPGLSTPQGPEMGCSSTRNAPTAPAPRRPSGFAATTRIGRPTAGTSCIRRAMRIST